MNHAEAIDASVAIKWVMTAEHLSAQAQALLQDCFRDRRALVAPPHIFSEVSSALYQRTRSREPLRHITEHEAQAALDIFLAYPIQLVATLALYREALAFATTHQLPSMYDVLYVVAARIAGAELWTADERLLAALGSTAPWVRFIGDYPLP